MDSNNIPNKPNRHARRASLKHKRNKGTRLLERPASEQELKDARQNQQSSSTQQHVDAPKKGAFLREMWDKVRKSHQHFELPEIVDLERIPEVSRVVILNKDGRERELLPDVPGRHVILCKGKFARALRSDFCIFCRITQPGDGSWAICPAELAMATHTTVQEVRRRSWWWLRRYSYEISFDGRIQPASLFWDYGVNPERRSLSMYVTHEIIRVKDSGEVNDYFRFWINKPSDV